MVVAGVGAVAEMPTKKRRTELTIWTYWHEYPIQDLFVTKCLENWRTMNAGLELVVLHDATIGEYIEKSKPENFEDLAVVVVTGAGVVVGARVVVVIGGCVVTSKKVIAGRVTGAAVRSNSLKGAIVFTTTVVSGGEVVVGAGVVVVVTWVVTTVGEGVTNWGRDTMASSTTSLPSLSLSIISIIFLISIM